MAEIYKRFVMKQHVDEIHFKDDVDRIVRICKQRGFEISTTDAQRVWSEYSDSMCAGWLIMPESDEGVFRVVQQQCDVIEEVR